MIDRFIDLKECYAVSAIFHQYNGGQSTEKHIVRMKESRILLDFSYECVMHWCWQYLGMLLHFIHRKLSTSFFSSDVSMSLMEKDISNMNAQIRRILSFEVSLSGNLSHVKNVIHDLNGIWFNFYVCLLSSCIVSLILEPYTFVFYHCVTFYYLFALRKMVNTPNGCAWNISGRWLRGV